MYPKMGYKKLCTPSTPKWGTIWGTSVAKNRGLGVKSTLNISKLEYFEAFWRKIQKLKFFRKKPKK